MMIFSWLAKVFRTDFLSRPESTNTARLSRFRPLLRFLFGQFSCVLSIQFRCLNRSFENRTATAPILVGRVRIDFSSAFIFLSNSVFFIKSILSVCFALGLYWPVRFMIFHYRRVWTVFERCYSSMSKKLCTNCPSISSEASPSEKM